MKSYHDRKHRAKAHFFVVGDVVYFARSKSDCNNKHKAKFDAATYVIIDFLGRDTCKVVSTLDGKVYVRNVKFLTRAPIVGQTSIFDDILDNREEYFKPDDIKRTGDVVRDTLVRTRSGRVSKPTRSKDFEYY